MPAHNSLDNLLSYASKPDVYRKIPYDISAIQHQYIVAHLCDCIKTCIAKEVYKPYIQIKDMHNKFVFNNRVSTTFEGKAQPFIVPKHEYTVDFIYDGNVDYEVYFMIQSVLANGEDQVAFGGANFDKPINELCIKDFRDAAISMIMDIEDIQPYTYIDMGITLHYYQPTANTWDMSIPKNS